jgi:hypothetical protein
MRAARMAACALAAALIVGTTGTGQAADVPPAAAVNLRQQDLPATFAPGSVDAGCTQAAWSPDYGRLSLLRPQSAPHQSCTVSFANTQHAGLRVLSVTATVDLYRDAQAGHRAYLPQLRPSPLERLSGLGAIGAESRAYLKRDYGTFHTPHGVAIFGRCGVATDLVLFRRGPAIVLLSVGAKGCAAPDGTVRGRPEVLARYARLIDSRIQRALTHA